MILINWGGGWQAGRGPLQDFIINLLWLSTTRGVKRVSCAVFSTPICRMDCRFITWINKGDSIGLRPSRRFSTICFWCMQARITCSGSGVAGESGILSTCKLWVLAVCILLYTWLGEFGVLVIICCQLAGQLFRTKIPCASSSLPFFCVLRQ